MFLEGEVAAMAYMDDGGVIGFEEYLVNTEHEKIGREVISAGLALHPEESHLARPIWERVGVVVDGCTGVVKAKPMRYLRLHDGTTAFIERKTAACLHLQTILGHHIHMFTLGRPLLSISMNATGGLKLAPRTDQLLVTQFVMSFELHNVRYRLPFLASKPL